MNPPPQPSSLPPVAPTSPLDDARFEFGGNWRRFLAGLDEARIDGPGQAIASMLGVDDPESPPCLDMGSGSGLSSLAAMQLGAARVHSFDYDAQSVACTLELQRRFFEEDPRWVVESGDATDPGYVQSLGQFDVVYSWGVLHHTG